MPDDHGAATRPSRAAWKDRAGFRECQDRKEAVKARREQLIQDYRSSPEPDVPMAGPGG
jgi:hypothetical protein